MKLDAPFSMDLAFALSASAALGLTCAGLAACGGSAEWQAERATDLPPIGAPLSTVCERTGIDWLDLEAQLPGRFHYGRQFTEVALDLSGYWGRFEETGDSIEGTSTWEINPEGLVVETGAGPCINGVPCDARFIQAGTLAVGSNMLAFYALWPVDPCQEGWVGTYEGREHYQNNRQTGGELRLWSERSERLTLRSNGTWSWQYEMTEYASVSDMGTVYWDLDPSTRTGEDSGTYEIAGDRLTVQRNESPTSTAHFVSSHDGSPVGLLLIGRAIQKPLVGVYDRVP